jgi:stage V sporulation protein AE
MYIIKRIGETKFEVTIVDYLWAFLIGGAICAVGQLLIDFTKMTPARILVLFVTLGVVLTAFGVYEPLVDFAGAGATVPLTGFGYLMAKGTLEAVKEHGLLGAFSGGIAAGAAGVAAAVFFGYLAALFSKPGDKS